MHEIVGAGLCRASFPLGELLWIISRSAHARGPYPLHPNQWVYTRLAHDALTGLGGALLGPGHDSVLVSFGRFGELWAAEEG